MGLLFIEHLPFYVQEGRRQDPEQGLCPQGARILEKAKASIDLYFPDIACVTEKVTQSQVLGRTQHVIPGFSEE